MELIEIRCDSLIKENYMKVENPEFHTYLPAERFPRMRCFVMRILAMFESTYLCEQIFSIMKNNRTAERSRLTDQHLSSNLKIASAQDLKIKFEDIVNSKRCQASLKK